jgi:outer membrane immunogenic protein
MKKLLLATTILALGAGSAFAADLPAKVYSKAPAVVPIAIYNWTGFYIGVEGGGSWGRSKHVDQPTGLDDTPWYNVNGGLAGGTAGYNWQMDHFVIGVEGDWSWVGQNGSVVDTGPVGNPAFSSFTKERWLATVRGRAGYAADSVLFYVTGGYAAASVNVGVTTTATGFINDQTTQTRSGWTGGAGIEWGFAPNWSAKLEYLYVGLQNSGFITPNLGPGFNRSNVPLNDNIVRVGVNYRFGGPVVARY